MTEERTPYAVPNQPPTDPPPAGELDALRNLGLRLLVAEVTWRWYRDQVDWWQDRAAWWQDLAVSILLAWMKERE